MSKKCSTPSCEGTVHSSSLCVNFYSAAYRWLKKGVGAIMKRKAKLQLYSERLESLNTSNVTFIRKKKRA